MSVLREAEELAPLLWHSLTGARRIGRLGHAFLLESDSETARERFAAALAMLAVCPTPTAEGFPCGVCRFCRQLEAGTYPELHHLWPVGKKYQIQVGDRENPEPNTARYFEDCFFLTSVSGASRKVGIVHEADRMGGEAQNALLKTLEEPPPESLMILTTGHPAALLPTTRSRCQRLQIRANHVVYDFPGMEELCVLLGRLFAAPPGDLLAAEEAASGLAAAAGSLRERAEAAVTAAWEARIAEAAEFDPALAKRLEKQRESAAAGAYMRERGAFLSAIHGAAAELYLLAGGAAAPALANPELLRLPEGAAMPDAARAARILKAAEDLLFNLRFNVGEELALRDFALQANAPAE